ncbi:MAG: DUF333 domain-containing protein [Candidatus Afipia apatlaquensis]|uniref:DUF333 domain-containing protein n=1 Tax=Candidatus Afipia apatlaquensis TaxID=2712852 RepID=A0A7C9REA5_9BRAD|nr:DUF333 domain-containing protein [Candidatus Afipia apatlaquensis]
MKLFLVLGLVLTVAECTNAAGEARSAQIANPASENCIKLGGRLEFRNEKGGKVGYCHLRDGRVIEEWALFRSGAGNSKH